MRQGHWVKKDNNNKVVYEGDFKNDVPIGEFKRYHTNGAVKAVMVYNADQTMAYTKLYDNTGELSAEGNYTANKQKDGMWKYYGQKETLCLIENYKEGKLNGKVVTLYENQNLAEELYWKDGKLDGQWLRYYENGNLRMTTQHVDGKRVGEFKVYYINGKPEVKGSYKDDLPDGTWKIYTEDGRLDHTLTYVNGKLSNEEEMDKELAKELNDMETNKNKYKDPEKFMDNPENYFGK